MLRVHCSCTSCLTLVMNLWTFCYTFCSNWKFCCTSFFGWKFFSVCAATERINKIAALCLLGRSIGSFALLCVLAEIVAVLLHFTVFAENMAVLLHLSIVWNYFTFFVPDLFAESMGISGAVFAERIFCVTFRSYWKWGKFLSMVRFWLKSSSVSLTLHYCCWKFLRGNLSLAVNYAGCIEFVISYFHTFQSEVSYAW